MEMNKNNKINICLVPEYLRTIGNLDSITFNIEDGASVRNKYFLQRILNLLRLNGLDYNLIALSYNIKFDLVGLANYIALKFSSHFNQLAPYSQSLLYNAGRLLYIDFSYCDIIFLHHYFSLLKYGHLLQRMEKGKRLILLEMPENPVETLGYLAKRRYGVSRFINVMKKVGEVVDIVLSPTLRDTLYYQDLFSNAKVFTLFNVFNIYDDYTDNYILSLKKPNALCISSWYSPKVYELTIELAKLIDKMPNIFFNEINVLSANQHKSESIGRVTVNYFRKMPYRDYLSVLAKCAITIVAPRVPWSGGHSVKRNDAALMGNVIIGSDYDLRGEPYPHEFTYIDVRDLVTKLKYLSDYRDQLIKYGMENRREALRRASLNEIVLREIVNFMVNRLLK